MKFIHYKSNEWTKQAHKESKGASTSNQLKMLSLQTEFSLSFIMTNAYLDRFVVDEMK